jgi:hypothetical protein
MLTAGEGLIRELKRRGMLGSYFSFRDYRGLRELDSMEEVREFVKARGFPVGAELSTAEAIVEFLRTHEMRENHRNVIEQLVWGFLYEIFLR